VTAQAHTGNCRHFYNRRYSELLPGCRGKITNYLATYPGRTTDAQTSGYRVNQPPALRRGLADGRLGAGSQRKRSAQGRVIWLTSPPPAAAWTWHCGAGLARAPGARQNSPRGYKRLIK